MMADNAQLLNSSFYAPHGRSEVAQYLHDAKESGDVVDNAAYEDAKNEQARLEGRILELEQLLAAAKPITKLPTDVVSLGSIVQLRTPDEKEYSVYDCRSF